MFRDILGAAWAILGQWDMGLVPLLSQWTLLLGAGALVAIPRQVGLLNLGAEGQIAMAGLGCYLPVTFMDSVGRASFAGHGFLGIRELYADSPQVVGVLLSFLGAWILATLWCFIPLILKSYLNINEVISGLFLNAIALNLASAWVTGPWKDPQGWNPETAPFPWKLNVYPSSALQGPTLVLPLLLLFLATLFFWRRKTLWGFITQAIETSPAAAHMSGFPVRQTLFTSGILAGLCCAFMACHECLGVSLRLRDQMSGGMGFLGIGVAFLGSGSLLSLCFSALFFAFLGQLAQQLQLQSNALPNSAWGLLQACAILFAVVLPKYFIRGNKALLPKEERHAT